MFFESCSEKSSQCNIYKLFILLQSNKSVSIPVLLISQLIISTEAKCSFSAVKVSRQASSKMQSYNCNRSSWLRLPAIIPKNSGDKEVPYNVRFLGCRNPEENCSHSISPKSSPSLSTNKRSITFNAFISLANFVQL